MRKRFYLLFGVVGLCLLGACQKEEQDLLQNQDLFGVWARETALVVNNNIVNARAEYHFYANSTFEFYQKITDPASGSLLGYRYKETGKYQVSGNSLHKWAVSGYTVNGNLPYARLEELIPDPNMKFWLQIGNKYAVPVLNNASKDVIQIGSRPCGINESCLPGTHYIAFTKEK